ncbi:MAG: hypothetical protein V5A44_04275 [Haloarculaceae archaeon]
MTDESDSRDLPRSADAARGARWRAGQWAHHRIPASFGAGGPDYRPPARGARVIASTDAKVAAPLAPEPAAPNPVLTASDLGADVSFVADPFLFPTAGRWHLFVEVFRPRRTPPAAIAALHSDDRGATWRYDGVVLDPGIHVAFPYVFEWDGDRYMLPEPWSERPGEPADFTLYRARSFPDEWEPVATPISLARELHDCVVFRHGGQWWGLVGGEDDELCAFRSDRLVADDWTPHPDNPVVTGRPQAARPGGRPVRTADGFVVFFQDCARYYGHKVRAYEVTELSVDAYADRPATPEVTLGPSGGLGWNSGRMHHIDAWLVGDRWLCVVDGNVGLGKPLFGDHWAVGLYEQPM